MSCSNSIQGGEFLDISTAASSMRTFISSLKVNSLQNSAIDQGTSLFTRAVRVWGEIRSCYPDSVPRDEE